MNQNIEQFIYAAPVPDQHGIQEGGESPGAVHAIPQVSRVERSSIHGAPRGCPGDRGPLGNAGFQVLPGGG